jgi:hypothetical protein
MALTSLHALRCYHCQPCAGFIPHVALASFPSSRWHCPQHHKLASAKPQRSRDTSVCMALLSWSSSLPMASSPYPASLHCDLAFDGPANAALASLLVLCWRPCPHCAGVIANIVLLSLPALHQRHCPYCMDAFALIALALLPPLLSRYRQHCELASAQSQNSCNMRWHHCQHCTVLVAGVALASMPLLCGCLCPCHTGVVALVTSTLPPASQSGICPVMTQLQHIAGEAFLLRSSLSPVALSLVTVPGVGPQQFGLQRSGQGSNGIFLAWHWRSCPHCTGVIASIKLSLLPALCRHCCRVGLQRSGRCSAGVCRRCTGILPALRWHHCQHCAVVIDASVVPALLPLARGCLCPHCVPLVVMFPLTPSSPYLASLPYPVSSTPILCFLSPVSLGASLASDSVSNLRS